MIRLVAAFKEEEKGKHPWHHNEINFVNPGTVPLISYSEVIGKGETITEIDIS